MDTPAIKAEFIGRIRRDDVLRLKIALANGCKVSTVDRWLRANDESLTTFKNLELLKGYYGLLEVQELLESHSLVA